MEKVLFCLLCETRRQTKEKIYLILSFQDLDIFQNFFQLFFTIITAFKITFWLFRITSFKKIFVLHFIISNIPLFHFNSLVWRFK